MSSLDSLLELLDCYLESSQPFPLLLSPRKKGNISHVIIGCVVWVGGVCVEPLFTSVIGRRTKQGHCRTCKTISGIIVSRVLCVFIVGIIHVLVMFHNNNNIKTTLYCTVGVCVFVC